MKTKCLIVDDEPLARELIRGHVEKLENFEIVAECSDAMKALGIFCNRYRVKNKSEFLRKTLMMTILKKFEEDHPTLWEENEPTLFNQNV
jgi:CheY-like chemotaxis protein